MLCNSLIIKIDYKPCNLKFHQLSAQKAYKYRDIPGSLMQKLSHSCRLLPHLHIVQGTTGRADMEQQMWSRCGGDQCVMWAQM